MAVGPTGYSNSMRVKNGPAWSSTLASLDFDHPKDDTSTLDFQVQLLLRGSYINIKSS